MDELRECFMPMKAIDWREVLSFPWANDNTTMAEIAGAPGSLAFIPLYPTVEALQAVHGPVPYQRVFPLSSDRNP
jgi:hypothetical protein